MCRRMSHLRKTLFHLCKTCLPCSTPGLIVHGDTIFGLPCSNPGLFLCMGRLNENEADAGVAAKCLVFSVLRIILCAKSAEDYT